MTVAMTSWREQVRNRLEPVLGIKIQPGIIEGPVEKTKAACIFPDAQQEFPEDLAQQLMTCIVRVFLPARTNRSPAVAAHNPKPLEELAEKIQVEWRQRVHEGDVWFSRCVGVEFDVATNMIEATFLATRGNPATVETP